MDNSDYAEPIYPEAESMAPETDLLPGVAEIVDLLENRKKVGLSKKKEDETLLKEVKSLLGDLIIGNVGTAEDRREIKKLYDKVKERLSFVE